MLPYSACGCWMEVKCIPTLLQGGLDLQQGLQHLSVAAFMLMVPYSVKQNCLEKPC